MNRTYFKLEVNGILLPEIYFDSGQAKTALSHICAHNVATGGRVIMY